MALVTPEFLFTKTYSALRDRLAFEHGGGIQPGVWDANDFKVVQRAAGANMSVDVGAGFALVDANNAGNAGLYHVENNAVQNVAIPAAHATLPRIDQILVDVSDSTNGGDAGDTPVFTVLGGTATAGATLANRTGANPTLPSNTLRVADILVGAAVTSITNTNIMDRRSWARGFFNTVPRAASLTGVTVQGTNPTIIDTATLQVRAELTGLYPVRISFDAEWAENTVSGAVLRFGVWDGSNFIADSFRRVIVPSAGGIVPAQYVWHFPASAFTAGSHVFNPGFDVNNVGSGTLQGPLRFTVEEITRQNANNA